MKLFMISNMADIAEYAFKCGVHRIMVDTETMGKSQRQAMVDAVFNSHEIDDVSKIKTQTDGEVICRINQLNNKSDLEIDRAVDAGADFLMVPMIEDELDVRTLVKLIRGRIRFIPLLETCSSLVRLKNIVEIDEIDELYFGLNDLSIQMKLKFLHEISASGLMRYCADVIAEKVPFGFGGIAKIGEGQVPAEYILSEHYLCKSSRVILGRAFHNNSTSLDELVANTSLQQDVEKLLRHWEGYTPAQAEEENVKLGLSITEFRSNCVLRNFKESA